MAGSIQESMHACASLLKTSEKIVIVGHHRADGDVIGTMMSLDHRLRSQAKRVTPFLFESMPPRYDFLGFQRYVQIFDPDREEHRQTVVDADVIVVLDATTGDRLPLWEDLLARRKGSLVRFDHHPSLFPSGADIDMTDVKACATGQIVYEFLGILDEKPFSYEEALGLFVAIATDTGWFRYSNTTPDALRQGSRLVEAGIEPAEVFSRIYQHNPLGLIRLMGRVFADIKEELDGRLLWGTISLDLIGDTMNAEDEFETDILLDVLRSSEKVMCVALFRELPKGFMRVNLRSKGRIAVNTVAEQFGGGGHRNAAGMTLNDSRGTQDVPTVVRALVEMLTEAEAEND